MPHRLLVVICYVGMALVFGAVAVRVLNVFGVVAGTPEMDRYAFYAALTGLALVIVYTLGHWREIADHFRQRNARYGALAVASVVICLGILVAVNYISTRHNRRWDLTENQQHSLSEQTVQLLAGLDAPVRMLVFDRELQHERFRRRLTEYQYHSGQVEVEYIDPDRDPVPAQEHEVQVYGTVVLEYMGRTERVTSDSEQDLTNALIKLLNPQEKKIYFLSGHGERSITDTGRLGYSAVADALRRDNYAFDTIVLAQAGAVPEDATIVAVVGPSADLLEREAAILGGYLDRGGKLLALVDPPDDFARPAPLPNLTGLLRDWGVEVTESVVVDLSGLTSVATIPVAASPYPAHPITDGFEFLTIFPMARAVVPASSAPDGRLARPFVETAPRSWAETSLASLEGGGMPAPDIDAGDIPGPVPLGVASSAPVARETGAAESPAGEGAGEAETPEETRVAVIGDSDFAANAYLGSQGNSDFFLNTVSWLAQQENLIAIRPREASDRRITLTPGQSFRVMVLALLVIPAGVAGAGLYTWWRRRSR